MRHVLSSLPAFVRQSVATMLQYRGELVLWAVWGVVYPGVSMAMWSVAVHGAPGGRQIGGYDVRAFAGYFWLTMVIGHFATAWDVYELGWLVQSGRMSTRLLRPVHPVWQSLADNLAYKVVTLSLLVPIWAAIVLVSRPRFGGDAGDWAAGLLAAGLAAVINFVWCYNLAMLAFWVTRMEAIGQAWFGAGLFLGGRLAPLAIMPEPLRKIAAALPFKWVIWFPCEVMMGRVSPRALSSGLANQAAWIIAGLVVFWLIWRAGVKRYSAVGA
jgi:ABC-2 type transport system permease protein